MEFIRENMNNEETAKEASISGVNEEKKDCARSRWSWETYLVGICLFLACLIGGAILVIWQVKHHHRYTQLWMVPVGLILFSTPILIFITSIVSELCFPRECARGSTGSHGLQPQPQPPV